MFKLFFHLPRCISYITFFLTRLLISISPLFCSKHNQTALKQNTLILRLILRKDILNYFLSPFTNGWFQADFCYVYA